MPKQTFLNLSAKKRQKIIDCAVDEFAEHGYRGASISRIVAAAGIAKGSFYQYFEDKEDLYGHVVDYAIVQRKLRVSGQQSVKLEELSLTQFIRVLFLAMMQEFLSEPKLLKIAIDYMRHRYDPVQKRIYQKYQHISDNYFQGFVEFEKQRGDMDTNVDGDVLSHMLVGAAYMISNRMEAHGVDAVTKEYVNDIVDKIEYILTKGIYTNAADSKKRMENSRTG